MADNIQTMIPRYGELNRIYRDYIDNRVFSFDRQKFISDFCQEYNDMKSFEAAILELVLDRQKEQYTLILNSLKTEIEKSIQAYETHPISDSAIERVCYQHMERYSLEKRDDAKLMENFLSLHACAKLRNLYFYEIHSLYV